MRQAVRRRGGEPEPIVPGGGQVLAFDRLRGPDREVARLVGLVAAERKVPTLLMLHPSRCGAEVAEARQLAMYLMHVILRRSYGEIGRFFGRDRTTVAHACAHIEDLRDSPGFEAEVQRLEAVLATAAPETGEVRHAAG